MEPNHPFVETCGQILKEELPNLFRLYLNPYVTQACYCLSHYIQTTWKRNEGKEDEYQTFLANSFDEALSGAIKLARFAGSLSARSPRGVILDPAGRLGPFCSATVATGRIQFVPGLDVCKTADEFRAVGQVNEPLGFVVLIASKHGMGRTDLQSVPDAMGRTDLQSVRGGMGRTDLQSVPDAMDRTDLQSVRGGMGRTDLQSVPDEKDGLQIRPTSPSTFDDPLKAHAPALQRLISEQHPLMIMCVDRMSLADLRQNPDRQLREYSPDIVVFDESFVNHDVPFGAFSARKELYDHWNRPGKTTFHSTTFQPNTISSLHFMRCLEKFDPQTHALLAPDLKRILDDVRFRGELFRRLYSPSLYKMIRMTGFETANVRASGDFVIADGRRVFDCVSGVACSVRGHNPPSYLEDLALQRSAEECRQEVASRLAELTGLEHVLPAVSGAGAVENALKVALVAQHPRRHVLALKSGFGGKTLFALTGTWNTAYKENIDPLYPDVVYVDPFAPDAISQIESALQRHPVAVVQLELIQAVGGIRKIPEEVVKFLDAGRQRWGYLLLVDEVQTGMYRTGPFTMSRGIGLKPDLLVIGKGTSDMMFPFALLLYSKSVQAKLNQAGSNLADSIRARYGYEFGYRTVLSVLNWGEKLRLAERVTESSALFARLLKQELAGCKAVRDVRTFGLLIGIELDTARWLRRWFRKRLYSLYLYSMLRHRRYPVLVGFCQYEPNVLKITPPLTVAPEEIQRVCATLGEVLRRTFTRLLSAALGGLFRAKRKKRLTRRHGE